MRRLRWPLLVALLVVLAGCATTGGDAPPPTADTPRTTWVPTDDGPRDGSTPLGTWSPVETTHVEPSASEPPSAPASETPTAEPEPTATPTPDPAERFPVPAGAEPTYAPDPEPPLSPDVDIQAFALTREPTAATEWYRQEPDGWTLRVERVAYDSEDGWVNRLVLTRGDEMLLVRINSAADGTELVLNRGTGVVAVNGWIASTDLGFGAVNYTVGASPPSAVDAVVGLGVLTPPGSAFPTDHSYLEVTGPDGVGPVYAPADGVLTLVNYRRLGDPPVDDYDLVIAHTNAHTTKLGHMASLDPALVERIGEIERGEQTVFVQVEAGDRLGTAPSAYSTSLDWWVYDANRELTGFVHPEYYGRSVHTASFLDYLTPDLRADFVPKFTREAPPIGGRIDYDVPGRLVGNWFVESDPLITHRGERQLAFVYSVHDPDRLRVSVGGTVTDAGRYAVAGDAPDPATVDAATGPVVYRLQRVTGDGEVRPDVVATLLVEVIGEHRLRVEAFDGDRSDPSSTGDAVTYVR